MKRCVGFFIFLLNCGLISAQDQLADNLQQQFNSYQSNTLQEKFFVHTDKTFYLAGETVWFKIYAVDASWHRPFAASLITYVEIINKDGKAVVQSKIAMANGTGNGSLILPGFLVTGNYIFRAYTSWMKNFSPDFYFEQTLQIVNTLKSAPVPAGNKITGSHPVFSGRRICSIWIAGKNCIQGNGWIWPWTRLPGSNCQSAERYHHAFPILSQRHG